MPDKRATQSKINGAKSSGPKTPEGIAACKAAGGTRKNRHYHSTLLPGESRADFEADRAALHAMWTPENPLECQAVNELASINWLIKRQYSSRNDELVRAYDDIVLHATPGMTTQDAIALADHAGVGPDGRNHSHTKAIQANVMMRNRVFNLLCKLKKLSKHTPRVLPPMETKDLTPPDLDPPAPSSFEPQGFAPVETAPAQEPTASFEAPAPEPVEVSPAAHAEAKGDILTWAKQNFAFSPDKAQKQILTGKPGRTLVLGARQTGKSTATALKVLWEAIQNPGRQILLGAPSSRQSGQIGQKARAAAHKLYGKKAKSVPEGFELPNGAQILSLPDSEETIRGFSNPHLIVVDEAAFVSDDIYKALLPTQATGKANVILLSTANGQSGFFFEQWVEQSHPWTRVQIDVKDCPRMNDKFLAEMRILLGEEDFTQEFQNKFLHAPGAIFTRDMIANAFKDYVKPLFPWDEQVMQ